MKRPRESHGMRRHPAYQSWCNMISRCTNSNWAQFKNWGGRGITVCPQWLSSFLTFWKDMGPTWEKGLTIDRINVDGNYEPQNCRWISKQEQQKNKTLMLLVQTPHGTMRMPEAAALFGLKYDTLYHRYIRQNQHQAEKLVDPVES